MISIIVAVAQNNVIGGDNTLLWHISEDLKHFKAITTGHPVVMGRLTYESLGRPLPNRRNIVITRQADFSALGCEIAHSLESALALFDSNEEVFIIGGGQIYAQALEIADKFYLTVVHKDYKGDTSFPAWDKSLWQEVSKESFPRGEKFEYPFDFIEYQSIKK